MIQAVVIHSGGMDSTLCLALAIEKYGRDSVVSLSFNYSQRHSKELIQAKEIAKQWQVKHHIIDLDFLPTITNNALVDQLQTIEKGRDNQPPNTFVVGRNGLMARLGAIFANSLKASSIYMGVMELEVANSGYPDCSRKYMDKMEEILRLDLMNPQFSIITPLVSMTKKETMEIANQMGILDFLVEKTISCYEGYSHPGCQICPACLLRNQALIEIGYSI